MTVVEDGRRPDLDPSGLHIPENVLDLLQEITEEHQAKVASGAFAEFMPDSRIGLLRAFERSNLFPPLYAKLVRLALKIPIYSDFLGFARGRTFEPITFAHLAANVPKGQVLISPSDTRAFFNLYHGGPSFLY